MNERRLIRGPGENLFRPEPGFEELPGHVVTLAFLSDQIPSDSISERLAGALCGQTDGSVVLVRLEHHDQHAPADGPVPPERSLNGEFHMPSEFGRTEGGFHAITLTLLQEPPTPAGVLSLLGKLKRYFRHVIIAAPAHEQPAPWLIELLHGSSLAYLFLRAATEDVYHLDVVLREARPRCPNGGAHLKPIGCLGAGGQIDGFDLLAQRIGGPIHLFLHDCPDRDGAADHGYKDKGLFAADVRRMAREINGSLTGLALSSGAAKGFAHIGVLQVLEENGIEVDVVAGASMGAYVGCLWAYGNDGAELERLARELEGRWALWTLLDPVFPPRRGFLRGYSVKKRLMRSIGHARFGELVRPLRVVAGNLATLERVVFSGGEVATAVHASIAVPGICVPLTVDGETYIDGGIVDPLPVDVLREMGVSRVIAVDVIPTPDRIRYGLQAEHELARQKAQKGRRFFRKTSPLEKQLNYFAKGNLFEILMRSVHGAQIRVAEAACKRADVVLRPEICDDSWLDYRNPGKFIALGREAAERHLDEIRALLERKETVHEQPTPEPVAPVI
jgi:NTE family protein